MQEARPPRIAVLEDDPICRKLIQVILRPEFDCALSGNGTELLRMVESSAFDLVLLDIGLPGESGLEIAREIRRRSHVPIVFVTGHDKESHEEPALNMGGDDFITKPFKASALTARIRSVLRRTERKADTQPEVVSSCDLRLDSAKFTVTCTKSCGVECSAQLTEMEFDILSILFKAREGIVTRDDIWRTIAGVDWDPQNRNIDVHIAHLRHKLSATYGATNLIQTLRGEGYRITSDPWTCGREPNDQ
jgi:DNA-binding response OmpR family regulator